MKELPGAEDLTPKKIVEQLDKYIVGQNEAKKSVAIAMRNRIRRQRLPEEMKKEVIPKNILMIGPTGVGKTEIAKRLADLSGSPFIKVEATRFTEVGYVGKSVESMIRELLEASINYLKGMEMKRVEKIAEAEVEKRLVNAIAHPAQKKNSDQNLGNIFGQFFQQKTKPEDNFEEEKDELKRSEIKEKLLSGELEDRFIDIELEQNSGPSLGMVGGGDLGDIGIDLQGLFGNMMPKKKIIKRMTIAQARKVLLPIEEEKLVDMDKIINDGMEIAENKGIIFIDEIDKVVSKGNQGSGPDVSREGVQRDLLPIVEGTTVTTKYGIIRTNHILFIAAGAFHISKPSELIPELQGRFPIRVELNPLTKNDFERILVEPKNSLVKQYTELLKTDGVEIEFSEDGIKEIAQISFSLNESVENIGARRLYTVIEKVLEEISFNAPEIEEKKMTINKDFVTSRMGDIVKDKDLSAYIL